MSKLHAVVTATALIGLAAVARGAEPLSVEDVVSMHVVTDVALAPGGATIAYVLSAPRSADDEPGPPRSELWGTTMDGAAPRRLSAPGFDASDPRWRPDGSAIAFLSERPSVRPHRQIWLLPRDGGEAQPLTAHGASIETMRWLPDGRSIVFIAGAPKDDDHDDDGRDWIVVGADDAEVDLVWRLDFESGAVEAVTSPADGHALDLEVAAAGRSLVVRTAPTSGADAAMMDGRLVGVDLATGRVASIAATEGKLGPMAVSPDGRTLAFLGATARNDPLAQNLYLVPVDGGTPERRSIGDDRSARDLYWVGNDRVVVAAAHGTVSTLGAVPVKGGAMTGAMTHVGEIGAVDHDARSMRTVVVADAPGHPASVMRLVTGTLERVTDHDPWLADRALARTETIEWTAKDGLRIEGVLTHPVHGGAGPHPLVVNPHGGPEGTSFEALDGLAQLFAARGYLVLQPNYRGSGGRGVAFSQGDHDDLGGREFQDILDGIDALVAQGLADPDRVAMGGWSYGGYLSALAATHHSRRFRAAIMGAGISNWISFTGTTDIPDEMSTVHWNLPMANHVDLYWRRSPLSAIAAARTPTLILFGANDDRVPPTQGHELHQALRAHGVETEMVLYPRAGHGVRERAHRIDLYTRQLEWIDRHLAGT